MPQVERSVLLKFSAQDMYQLVGNVQDYPQFLPGCISAAIEHRDEQCIRARLGFRVRGLSDSFATENRHDADGQRIHMRLLEGPFRQLSGQWDFLPLTDKACKVSLQLSLEFGNRVLEATLSPWIDRAVGQVMEAFRQRATMVYGDG